MTPQYHALGGQVFFLKIEKKRYFFNPFRKFSQQLSSKTANTNCLSNDPNPDFRTVFEAHKDRVFNTVLSLVQHRHDAEDVTQDVFVTVHESLASFRAEAQVSTWIYRIAVNKSLDFLKSKKTKKRSGFLVSLFGEKPGDKSPPLDLPDFFHPGVALERKEQAATLFRAINKLPDNQKAAFTLAKIEGLSYVEIATVLQVTVPSVESLIFRARQNLQKFLKDFYQD